LTHQNYGHQTQSKRRQSHSHEWRLESRKPHDLCAQIATQRFWYHHNQTQTEQYLQHEIIPAQQPNAYHYSKRNLQQPQWMEG
jgi:hypothetical protein